jgi:endoglucanase
LRLSKRSGWWLAVAWIATATCFFAHAARGADATSSSGSARVRAASVGGVEAGRKGLHVRGNRLLDARGRLVHFRGVNRSGTEYACIQGWGIFDGPSNASSVRPMASWHVNAVRIPLNEDCWLDINGVKQAYAGSAYRNAIVRYVRLLHRYNMYAELSLMWAAPGVNRATYQPGAPDADHSPALWRSLASTFKNDRNVILAPWGETVVNADCFLRGGVCEATYGPGDAPYATAGMQRAVTVMRQAGYKGVIAIPGIDYANDLSKWLSHRPKDPRHQLIAEAHVYGKNTCSSKRCLNSTFAPVARRVPLILGETGETYDASGCGSKHISTFLRWADAHNVGYEAWTWDTWGNCEALIRDYRGRPRGQYGAWVKSHYALRARSTHGPRR